jgi:hypothetical protein
VRLEEEAAVLRHPACTLSLLEEEEEVIHLLLAYLTHLLRGLLCFLGALSSLTPKQARHLLSREGAGGGGKLQLSAHRHQPPKAASLLLLSQMRRGGRGGQMRRQGGRGIGGGREGPSRLRTGIRRA